MNQVLERGDVVALKNGIQAEVQSVRMDGERLIRFDYINRSEASPMRRTAYPSELLQVLRKNPNKPPAPTTVRSADHKDHVQKVVVVKKEEGYEVPDASKPAGAVTIEQAAPLTPGVDVPAAVIARPKPVVTRIKRTNKIK